MDGRLSLGFDNTGEGTTLRVIQQEIPWKVVRGFTTPTGECLAHLNNVSGGVLGGDRLQLDIQVGQGANAQITTTGATRMYAPRPESAPSLLSTKIHLSPGALLEYLPDLVIPFRGVRAEQKTHITLEEGATLFWWETLAPGRLASGECFEYECLSLVSEVWTGSVPILIDRMRLEPRLRPVSSPARFGGHKFLTTFVVAQVGAPQSVWRELELQLQQIPLSADGVAWGISALPAHGVLIRGLSDSGLPIAAALHEFLKAAKLLLCGRPVTLPRKTY